MKDGIVEQMGTPQEIYYHPSSMFVAAFIGEANFLKATVVKQDVVKVEGSIINTKTGYLPEGLECALVLRPEVGRLEDDGLLPCRVTYSCFMGVYQNYHVTVGDTNVIIQEYNPRNKKIYKEGDSAYLSFDEDSVFVIKM